MSRKLFGTDGIRGVANGKLTPELAFSIAQAAGNWLQKTEETQAAVVGMDTRRSGPMLESAVAAGLCSTGIGVLCLGVAPTPAVSYVARTGPFGLGVIISASHNPAPDNGIKFVGHDGRKLVDEVELEIEELAGKDFPRPTGELVGPILRDNRPLLDYLDMLETIVPERLDGMKIAVDCANGAAASLGPEILRRLGAEILVTGDTPDGLNINAEGGATKPETIQRLTVDSGADIGVAFDGDADRAVFSDEKGRLINGDRTIGIWAVHRQREHKLSPAVVVGTVMSNGGFEHYMDLRGIKLERTPVGDKYVAQKIAETGALIGGEQSGHIIFPAHGPTGDGLVTMLELLRVLKTEGRPASSYYDEYRPWPQMLVNVEIADRETWSHNLAVRETLEAATKALEGCGRVNVRASGTQPMIRVMVEADSYEARDAVVDDIVGVLQREVGGKIYGKVDLTHALGD
ncbi:MAG TPA: phosphoglucosamine mutase [Fimbriimonadaceae bacterium]|nr:phosphoglucosamine mutase [Fimbriimonadaceae bacterium]